ncbi:MAG TPA: sigma factor-like helix-turn-helix DNA-binding protein [Caulobacteraceae bacterium]|nr:sigma factor-like helix-turn-helix DNA-binding protein [Caulobacteraceae bacterium]
MLALPAYLSRIATNLWLDALRRSDRAAAAADPVWVAGVAEPAEPITRAAGEALFSRTAPQERAAVVLKDVFAFTLEEIAAILGTTQGAVKSALHRGRGKLAAPGAAPLGVRGEPASVELIDRFVAAFNARDIAAVTATLLETVAHEARGVGGERGRDAVWLEVTLSRPLNAAVARAKLEGEAVMISTFTTRSGRTFLTGVSRLEAADGLISRHVGYGFCPETLTLVGEALGLEAANNGYHQDPATLERMIGGARLPWARP